MANNELSINRIPTIPSGKIDNIPTSKITGFNAAVTGAVAPIQVAIIQDQKTQNTNAQTITNAWVARDLNTEVCDTGNNVTIGSSGQFTLTSGTYIIDWQAPYTQQSVSAGSQTRLYNVSDASVVQLGASLCSQTYESYTISNGMAYVTIASSKIFQIEHRAISSGNYGGKPTNLGVEIYTSVKITKIA